MHVLLHSFLSILFSFIRNSERKKAHICTVQLIALSMPLTKLLGAL